MTWSRGGSSASSVALKLGPEQNTFTGNDLAEAQAARDVYFAANPTVLAAYDGNPNNLIRLTYTGGTSYEARQAGSWVDYTPVVEGPPGDVASLVDVPVGQVPFKRVDGTFGGSRMRVLDDGSLLAPPGFGVESGSVQFGDVLLLSEAAGFLQISNLINERPYTVLDYYTPRTAPSASPSAFMADDPAFSFVAQAVDTVNLSTNPLVFDYTIQNTSRTYSLFMRTYAAMNNVRIKITQVSNNVTLKYVPTKEAWETGVGGLTWGIGDNTFDFADTPLILRTGQAVRFEIEADVVALKGNNSGIAYFGGLDQLGTFQDVVMVRDNTATHIRDKLASLTGTNRLSMDAIKDGVVSVAGRTGAVVLSATDVSGLSTVATTGAYNDLTGKPTIPTTTSQLTNNSGFITAADIPVTSVAGRTGAVVLTKTDVGLGNVDNTSDANKPVSTAQQTAIDLKMSQHLAAGDPHPQYTTAAEAAAAAPVQSVNGSTGAVSLTSGGIPEGSNLYYTDSRVGAYLTTAGYTVKSSMSTGTGAQIYGGNAAGVVSIRSLIGTGIASVTQNANDVTINVPAPVYPVTSVNSLTGAVSLTTTGVPEGSNLYYTDARVGTYLTSNGYTVKSIASSGSGASVVNSTGPAATLRAINGTGMITVTQNANDITIAAPTVVGGTYTPTITNSTNTSASTAFLCMYTRVDGMVQVHGKVNIDPTNSGTSTRIEISLPIASNLGAVTDLAGNSGCPDTNQSGGIYGSVANDRAVLDFQSGSTAARDHYFSFMYRVI